MKKIYKYPTGAEIPEGAVYLSTVAQDYKESINIPSSWNRCWLVWHYFLVEVTEPSHAQEE